MATTRVSDDQILDGGVTRADLNVASAGSAVITKLIAGTGVSISSTGADAGTGDVTVNVNTSTLTVHDAGVVTNLTSDMFSVSGLQITVPTLDVGFYDNDSFQGPVRVVTVLGSTLLVPDNSVSYVYASWNSGSPTFGITTNVALITESSVVPINTLIASNGFVHLSHWNNVANGLANKLHRRFVKTNRYALESGLELSVTSGVARIAPGVVWRGVRQFNLNDVYSDGRSGNQWFFAYKAAGSWQIQANAPAFNYTQYQDANDLVALQNLNRFNINWIFRGVEDHEHGYRVLSGSYKTYQDALAETSIPTLPSILSTHATLAGRIICELDNPVPVSVETYRPATFTGAVINDHNSLGGLQGGSAGQEYHSTQLEHDFLSHITANRVGRDDVNTTVTGHAIVAKILAGTNVSISSSGVDAGTGDVTISAAAGGFGAIKFTAPGTLTTSNGVTTKVTFTTQNHLVGNIGTFASSRFTAGAAGVYRFFSQVSTSGGNSSIKMYAYVNGVQYEQMGNSASDTFVAGITDIQLAANDYVEIWVNINNNRTILATGSYFCISRIY